MTIVFKGSYFRDLQSAPAGGASPVELIANSAVTMIPGTSILFGSLAPPSAGGIYYVRLASEPELETLVSIGGAGAGRPSQRNPGD